jgi:ABC-type multidrug transport system fused ATPase/permease subunit
VHETWRPERGEIEFRDVKMRYRKDLPLTLKGISFKTNSFEKIGVCGRTGAGKSSLINCLLRLTEIDEGSILIDSTPINSLGLHDLRHSIAIIPQTPLLFTGTLRYNLDPFDDFSDFDLWNSLKQVQLFHKINHHHLQLLQPVTEGGSNFSVGERQLLCFARAILRNSSILILDEATASVDTETDKIIQEMIREVFVKSTVLTIAHRIATIIDYDKVIVLDSGLIVEFDSPSRLLSDPNSVFSGLSRHHH